MAIGLNSKPDLGHENHSQVGAGDELIRIKPARE
jgi:hypothetical protein